MGELSPIRVRDTLGHICSAIRKLAAVVTPDESRVPLSLHNYILYLPTNTSQIMTNVSKSRGLAILQY